MRIHRPSRSILVLALFVLGGCGDASEKTQLEDSVDHSPSARLEIVEAIRADQAAQRHPADGGGEVWFLDEPKSASVSQPGSWSFIYRVGSLGIAKDGWLFFQAPPFWGWSTPQVEMPDRLGFTRVRTEASGAGLEAATIDQQLLAVQIQGRALTEGEEVVIEYGVGSAGAIADRFAESRSCFYFAVDGDGDGVRALVGKPLCVEVEAGPAARLWLSLPTTARPGERVRMRLGILDSMGNRVSRWTGVVGLVGPPGLVLPGEVTFGESDAGARVLEFECPEEGIVLIMGSSGSDVVGKSNRMLVSHGADRVLWADLHGHSALSDGTGTPRDYFRFARDLAGLDVVALTDHDHWGMQPLAVHPELWEEIRRETEVFHRPGEFVTLLGYEWTSWIHGHRHVLYFSDQGVIRSSIDPEFESPLQLWEALRGQEVLTFAHHSAGGPIATNWLIPPDPELEPVTEIVSVHGSSEALDSPAVIYSPVPGNFVRDVLDQGYVLGFVGSGDGHDGHPGLSHLNAASGGLAAIMSEDLTREGVLDALRSRRVYATNGPRILLRASLAGHRMGSKIDVSELNARSPEGASLVVFAMGADILQQLDLIRSGEIVESIACAETTCSAQLTVSGLKPGEYLYLRAVQTDGGAAWSSPFFLD